MKRGIIKNNKLIIFTVILLIIKLVPCISQCNRHSDSLQLIKLYNSTNGANWIKKWDLSKPIEQWYGVFFNNEGCVVDLYLSQNNLEGQIPNLFLPTLQILQISKNKLNGFIPNFKLNKLKLLALNDNKIIGCIPDSIKINCPLIGASGGNVRNNILLSTENWEDYWNSGEGSCSFESTSCHYKDSLRIWNWFVRSNNPKNPKWKVNWAKGLPLKKWEGIDLNNDGCIIRLGVNNTLSNKNIDGYLPNFNLPNLISLDLSENFLSGNIPKFNFMPKLYYIYLQYNNLSDTIPNFSLQNLIELRLHYNNLSGKIPNFDLPNIKYIKLDNNSLSGEIPNFNYTNINFLELYKNKLSGNIPDFKLPKLYYLDLGINQLNGNIPDFKLPSLGYIRFQHNQLSGNIPNFKYCESLNAILLSNNRLGGMIPDFNLPSLSKILLDNNDLVGCIPEGIKIACPKVGAAGGDVVNNPKLHCQKWANYWNMNEGACTIGTKNAQKPYFTISPIPTNDNLVVNFEHNSSGKISIINSIGQLLLMVNFQEQAVINLNTEQYNNGVYLLHISLNNEIEVLKKIVIQH